MRPVPTNPDGRTRDGGAIVSRIGKYGVNIMPKPAYFEENNAAKRLFAIRLSMVRHIRIINFKGLDYE